MSLEYISPIAQAVATFAGAVFVLLGIWYKDRLETNSKARNAKVQFVAEIRALLDLIAINNYMPSLAETIEELRAGERSFFYFSSSRSVSSVYEANLHNLGLLNAHASEVVRFYMILFAALEDKDAIGAQRDTMKQREEQGLPLEDNFFSILLQRHELLELKLQQVVLIGNKICKDLAI